MFELSSCIFPAFIAAVRISLILLRAGEAGEVLNKYSAVHWGSTVARDL